MKKQITALMVSIIIIGFFTACKKETVRQQRIQTLAEVKQSIQDHFGAYVLLNSSGRPDISVKLDSAFCGSLQLYMPDSLYLRSAYAFIEYGNQRHNDALYTWPHGIMPSLNASNVWTGPQTYATTQAGFVGKNQIDVYLNNALLDRYRVDSLLHKFSVNQNLPLVPHAIADLRLYLSSN